MARDLLGSPGMRSSLVAVAVALVLMACGGSVAPSGSSGSSGTSGSGTSGSGSANGSGSDTGSTSGATGRGSLRCPPGAYVFCRCQDRSEGTKLCQQDGKTFSACQCEPQPVDCLPPPPEPNPPGCPASYSRSYSDQPCGDEALECAYPTAGDPGPDGCPTTAILSCRVAPGGSRVWYAGP